MTCLSLALIGTLAVGPTPSGAEPANTELSSFREKATAVFGTRRPAHWGRSDPLPKVLSQHWPGCSLTSCRTTPSPTLRPTFWQAWEKQHCRR
jgi:hypothetical protein